MTDLPVKHPNAGRPEWVSRAYLHDLTSRAQHAENCAALLLAALALCQAEREALTIAAIAVLEGDADGFDRLKELLRR